MIFNKRGWLFLPLLLGSALMAGGGFIRNFEEESLPEVEATGSLLAIDAPGRDNAADTPAERSAAKVAVPDKLFEWTPSPDPGRVTGGADLIDALRPTAGDSLSFYTHETFATDVHDLVSTTLDSVSAQVYEDASILPSNKNKAIVEELYRKGIFRMKNAVGIVAELLDISRNTVYMHIRNYRRAIGDE